MYKMQLFSWCKISDNTRLGDKQSIYSSNPSMETHNFVNQTKKIYVWCLFQKQLIFILITRYFIYGKYEIQGPWNGP